MYKRKISYTTVLGKFENDFNHFCQVQTTLKHAFNPSKPI